MDHYVVKYDKSVFIGVMAGMGRNRGTWDTSHSRRTAQRHARALRKEQPNFTFMVETL